ncbi:unnamed protein product [Coregonus sp. 'balchen']|nr:unnamed protein product [Coregonus sp. 'balchen']
MLFISNSQILNRWFESEPLKATLATDAVIGAMTSPNSPGSGYVLLHHVMGELEKEKGAWGYVEGGMGGVSKAIASSARSHGADIFTEQDVHQVLVGSDGSAKGVVLKDGTEIHSRVVLSNATPYVTFKTLTPQSALSPAFIKAVDQIDYTSPSSPDEPGLELLCPSCPEWRVATVAVDKLPDFLAAPTPDGKPGPHHQCSIHLNCESVEVLQTAYNDCKEGRPSSRYTRTQARTYGHTHIQGHTHVHTGSHTARTLAHTHTFFLFSPLQAHDRDDHSIGVGPNTGAPWKSCGVAVHPVYSISSGGRESVDRTGQRGLRRLRKSFSWIEQYAPGFKSSIVGKDVLTPPDLERIFGLTGGNIFHGAMSLDQLYLARPLPSLSDYRSPIKGLYLCGSGSHPGL